MTQDTLTRDIEVGREGAVGGIVSHGHLPAYTRMIVKFGGGFVCLKVADLEAAKAKSVPLRHYFARYADCLLAQVFQATACNAIHSTEQRAAKWIIAATERTGDDVVPFTHEELAAMLGAGRSHTTRVLQGFRARGMIETRRTAVSESVDARQINNLPINGRNYVNFTLINSQAARDSAPSIGAAPTSGLNFGGQRARSNQVSVDGADAGDNSTNGIRSTVSQEAVQEFQLIISNYMPEFGRATLPLPRGNREKRRRGFLA